MCIRDRNKYRKTLDIAIEKNIGVIVNGGDMLPKLREGHLEQPSFINGFLRDYFSELEKHGITYLAMLGNDDFLSVDGLFDACLLYTSWAIGQAVTAMVGQCMGAGQVKRIRKVVKISLLMNVAVTLVVVISIQIFAKPLILLFGSTSPEVVNDGVYYLRICCGFNSLIYAAMYTLDSFAIGVGAANVAMINADVYKRQPLEHLLKT